MKRIDRLRERLAGVRSEIRDALKPADGVVQHWQPSAGDVLDRVCDSGMTFFLLTDGRTVLWRIDGSMVPVFGPAEGREASGMSEDDWWAYLVAQCDGEPLTAMEAAAMKPPVFLVDLSRDEIKWFKRLPESEREAFLLVGG